MIAIRVLVINQQLDFTVSIKHTLEQIGGYEVTGFTGASAAFEHLRGHPQDVALVDFLLPDIFGADIILRLRTIQPDIAVIATPYSEPVAAIAADLNLQGVIDVPCPARELVPVIQGAVKQVHDTLPDTAQAPAVSGDSETMYLNRDEAAPLVPPVQEAPPERPEVDDEAVYVDTSVEEAAPSQSIEIVMPDVPEPDDQPGLQVFERLAREEPPLPGLEDSGTVGDLMIGVSDKKLEEVMAMLKTGPPAEGDVPRVEGEEDDESPARLVLITALDDTTPLSLPDLLASIEQQFPESEKGVRPLPSWMQESDRFVREPDFLPEDLPGIETGQYASDTTTASHMEQIESPSGDMTTERLDRVVRTHPQPESISDDELLEQWSSTPLDDETPQHPMPAVPDDTSRHRVPDELESGPEPEREPEREPEPEPESEEPEIAVSTEMDTFAPAIEPQAPGLDSSDPYIAQLALSLTQVSLETTAEATLLAHNGEIIAYAGNMPYADIEDIRGIIADDWNAEPGRARIRFVTLPSSGGDYMLYSRSTAGDFTLTMIFAGNLPLHVIRRQSTRLVEALQSVPEPSEEAAEPVEEAPEPEEEPLPPVEVGPRTAFTYVWLVRDPDYAITDSVAQALVRGLDAQLSRRAWGITTLHVYEDFVYLMAEVPGEEPAQKVVRDLMHRSAHIVQEQDPSIDPESLWADCYLILTPGRVLEVEEIQSFINFAR